MIKFHGNWKQTASRESNLTLKQVLQMNENKMQIGRHFVKKKPNCNFFSITSGEEVKVMQDF